MVGVRKVAVLGLLSAVLMGCGGDESATPAEVNKARLDLYDIAEAYTTATDSRGQPPRGANDLKPYLKRETTLKSPNDGEPYVIVWGLNLEELLGSRPIFAYERKGSGGRRHVVNAEKSVMVLTDAEFAKATFPPGHQPPK